MAYFNSAFQPISFMREKFVQDILTEVFGKWSIFF